MDANVPSKEFNFVIKKLRDFCHSKGLVEACVQHRTALLSACEDPKTITTYLYRGIKQVLPQTGQMHLETEMLQDPFPYGYFTLTTSYRQEPNPVPGRHDLIFPMFEFELKGNITDLMKFEMELLAYLGFDMTKMKAGRWEETAALLNVDDIDHHAETRIANEMSNIYFLTHFPRKTDPFWNMRFNEDGSIANKIDVILYGMETIGSAERSTSVEQMREGFATISNGEYAGLLYSHFGKERVDAEMNEYLSYNFIERSGGGIGMTRLLRAMRLEGLLNNL